MNFNDAHLADIDKVTRDTRGAAVDVILVDDAGTAHPMRAFFEAPQSDIVVGSATAPVISGVPVLHIPTAYVTAAIKRPLTTRDSFTVLAGNGEYTAQAPRDDSQGMIVAKLQKRQPAPSPFPPIPAALKIPGGSNG